MCKRLANAGPRRRGRPNAALRASSSAIGKKALKAARGPVAVDILPPTWPPASSPVARDSSARICATSCCARGHRVICVDNFETGSLANIEHIRVPEFVHLHVDIIEPFFVDEPVDFVYHFASPASPIDYLRLPLHTLKVGSYGTHHALGLAKQHRARFLTRLDVRGLRRPAGPSAARVLLGPREPDRPARRLRRGQALRRGADDGLPPPAGRRHGDRADLQHLRPADAPARRPRDPDVPAPGAAGPADHGVRRRLADALVLLRRRPDRRHHPARRVRRAPARSTSATRTSSRCSSWPRP